MPAPYRLLLPLAIYQEMVAHGRAELPLECCGFLAGNFAAAEDAAVRDKIPLGRVEKRYPLVNEAHSSTEYLSDSKSMFDAVRDMRQLGLEVLAVYHSHPTSDPIPSRKDREQNYWDVMNLIVSYKTEEPHVRGWWLTTEEHWEGVWEIDRE